MGRAPKRYLSAVPADTTVSALAVCPKAAWPQTKNSWEEVKTKGIDIIIAMDVSGSMLAQDLKPDRLDASKEIAIDFIKGRKNDRIGLIVFSGQSFTQCPLTTDHSSVINLFDGIKYGMVDDGTAIGDGLGNAINRLKHSDARSKIVILLTDGENTSGKIAPMTAAQIAASDSIKIKLYTIGVGTKGMAKSPIAIDFNGKFIYDWVEVKIDEETLKNIAKKTGGRYFRATDNKCLKEIYKEIDKLETTEIETIKFHMQNKVEKIEKNNSGAIVITSDKDGKKNNFDCEVVLISVGRKPNTEGLNLERVGVKLDERKRS